MGCCGDTAAVTAKIIAARSLGIWEDPGGFTLAKENDAQKEEQNPYVQLEFIGPQVGSVTYMGLTGESYKAGNNEQDRIVNALRGDAEKLLALRDFGSGKPLFQQVGGEKLPKVTKADQVVDTGPSGEFIPLDPGPADGNILTDPAAAAAVPNAGVVADVAAAEDTAVAEALDNKASKKSK